MRPLQAIGELRQKGARGEGAGVTAADVGEVREVAAQHFHVFIAERQVPGAVVGATAGGVEVADEFLVVAHEARVRRAQRHHAGAGERGDIDDGLGLEAARVGEGIAQDEPAFGVRIQHFDGEPLHGAHHVAGLGGAAAGHVLAGRDDADHIDRGAHGGECLQGAEHAGSAAHVELHLVHGGAGLQADAAGVEGDALADQRHRCDAGEATVVLHDDELEGLFGTAGHGQERAHLQFPHLGFTEDLDTQGLVTACEVLGRIGQMGGGANVAREIGEVACQRDAGTDGSAFLQAADGALEVALFRDREAEAAQLRRGRLLRGFQVVHTVQRRQGAFGEEARAVVRVRVRQRLLREQHDGVADLRLGQCLDGAGDGAAIGLAAPALPGAKADQQGARRALQQPGVTGAPGKVSGLQQRGDTAVLAGIRCLPRGGQFAPLIDADDGTGRGLRRRATRHCVEFHLDTSGR